MVNPNVERFSQAARLYCEFIEIAYRYELGERLATVAALLADLYAAGLRLREYQPNGKASIPDSSPPPPEVADWHGFEELTMYWHVPNPYDWSAPEVSSLTDNLLDIYREIKRSLLIFDRGETIGMDYAIYQWQNNFMAHWGTSAVAALRAIHEAICRVSGN